MSCCESPPSIGKWKIYVKTPIYFPPRVKYNWNDNTGIQTTEGDSYVITETVPDNTACNVTVRTYQIDSWNGVPYQFNTQTAVYLSRCPAYLYRQTVNNNIYLYLVGGTINPYWQQLGSFNAGYGLGAEILSQVPTDPNTPKIYRLQIYRNGQMVYDETRLTQPTAQQLPEGCLQNEQRTFVRDYQNWKSQDYCYQQIQGNQTNLFVMSEQLNGGFVSLLLAYQSSDERCSLAPIFEVECEYCKKCPENTCEVICGDHICCYNLEGISVDSFPIGELCP